MNPARGRSGRHPRPGLSLLLLPFLAAACGGGETSASTSGEVVLYTSMPDAVVDRLEGVIEQRFPDLEGDFWIPMDSDGISLTVVRGRTADIEQRIADEIEGPGGLQADLIWLAEASQYEVYKEMGLLAPLAPPVDAPIPAGYIDPDGYYVAGRLISMVVAWNTDLNPGGLSDWPDLHEAAPTAFPAPESGAARATISAINGEYGPEFFTTLAAGGGVSVGSNEDALDGLVAGRFEAVAVLDYMAREAKAAGAAIDFAYPAGGTVVIPSPIALTSSARNPEAARAVVEFVLSRRGQRIIVEIGNFYPVRTDVAPPAGAPPLDSIATLDIDWAALGEEIDDIGTLWDTVFGPAGNG